MIVHIYYYGKTFYCTCLKTTDFEMMLSYAKALNEKMRKQLAKLG